MSCNIGLLCVCAMHSTSLSSSSPHPFPSLPSFFIFSSFKALLVVLHCSSPLLQSSNPSAMLLCDKRELSYMGTGDGGGETVLRPVTVFANQPFGSRLIIHLEFKKGGVSHSFYRQMDTGTMAACLTSLVTKFMSSRTLGLQDWTSSFLITSMKPFLLWVIVIFLCLVFKQRQTPKAFICHRDY